MDASEYVSGLKKFKREDKDKRSEWLKRKWGMANLATNDAFEHSRKLVLNMVMSRFGDLRDAKSEFCDCDTCKERPRQTQKEYFEDMLKHEEKWARIWEQEYND